MIGDKNMNELNEEISKIKEMMGIQEKEADRCLKIARRKYDKPSAYRSGAIVRCRQGKIWKDLKESGELEEIQLHEDESLITMAHAAITRRKGRDYAPDVHELQAWIDEYLDKQKTEEVDEVKKTDYSKEKKSGLHGWFSRRGGDGNKGWVDCNTCRKVDGRKKCKACGREKGEKRSKYPSCRPTPASCGTPGKGKKWGKTKNESINEVETKPVKRVALLFIVVDNKVLLFKRSPKETTNPGKYGMLGGGIEKGESPQKALRREIQEEAGVTLGSFKPLKKYKYDGVELNVFYTNTFPVDDIRLDTNEHTSHKFFTLEDVMNMTADKMISTNKDIANDYNNKVSKKNRLSEELNRMMNIMGEDRSGYLKWKRANVTLRGVKEVGEENNAGAMLGRGLYTAALSNKSLAKEYGQVYFVVGAIPKNPKVFNTLNEWEIWFYNTLVFKYSKENGKEYPDKRDFYANTTIEDEMMKMGYDGVVIKGREMVNFKPDDDDVKYFSNEMQLNNYYEFIMDNTLNEETFMGNHVWDHIVNITPNEDDIPWGFRKKIRNAEFNVDDNFNLESLLETDPDFREYFESGDDRYGEDDVDESDLYHDIVVVDGELLDGYSRTATLLRNGETRTSAFVGTNKR
jgi:8-oxo-dGTP pyrophosphatase MutT (NUDIX family)